MNDKQAAEFEATQGVQLRHQPGRHRPLPRQLLHAAGARRHGAAHDHHHDPELRGPWAAAGAQGRRDDQARPGDLRRRHRLRQVDLAGGDGRLPQREQLRPHHHHRGPGRIRPPAQELHRHPARSRRGHGFMGGGAEEHPAPGARRDPDRRDPRPRDHGACDRLRRDRPPVPGHAARQQREPGDGPHHQLLPRGPARTTADGPVAQPQGRRLAAPAPAEGRQGARPRRSKSCSIRR